MLTLQLDGKTAAKAKEDWTERGLPPGRKEGQPGVGWWHGGVQSAGEYRV